MSGRRAFLRSSAALLALAALPSARAATAARTRLVLLGTGGGPRPKKDNAAPSQAILIGEDLYVIDCGNGVARQIVRAGLPLPRLRHVFVTHQHSDHNADYGNLLLLSWASGLRTRVDTWGPPPLENMTRLYFQLNAFDIATSRCFSPPDSR